MRDLEGKVAIVTGGGGAIGRASSLAFARAGASVLVVDIKPEAAAETVDLIGLTGGVSMPWTADVSVAMDVERMVNTAVERFGGLDLAFNNAGITDPGDALWDEAIFRRLLEVNLVSQMLCMKYQIPRMLARGGGAIVNMSSVMGVISQREPILLGYTASKHGVIGLTKAAALQYARQNIRVNALCPGVTRSAMVDAAMAMSDDIRHALENYAPLRGVAEPEEIAEAALWLCSPRSGFVTGHSLVVDGGYTIQ
ncbi:MAG: glucose 1-dehydrogenase [Steroidobacteraceae bacterium]|nr:glucose 1-dehydrogenase [Nevskiaceae bacterium]MCP5359794.1 glucose 1-dehydrogenase [Nevskiaceae bacterium]MCP5467409.1 glucose 1-dehydrogenase [Nevskiaceae bacterium]MCP5472716.1 glucose 1-dehydrogenase [Nevskiaceae bacterium]